MELLQILVAWVQLLKVFGQVQNLRGTVDQLLVGNVENLLELLDLINGVRMTNSDDKWCLPSLLGENLLSAAQ